MNAGFFSLTCLSGVLIACLFEVNLDLLTSRAFEREALSYVPGPTTPDQKTKRTTLRKSTNLLLRARSDIPCNWQHLEQIEVVYLPFFRIGFFS